jgi:glycosyltransferase involved in cell wall biosynthesis
VAIARSLGIDTRLEIVGPSTSATEWRHRRELEALVKSVALTDVVQITEAVAHTRVPELLQQAHVLVDAGSGDDLSLSVVEAMGAGRAVVSSSAAVARLIGGVSSVPLSFEVGSAAQLAERIGGLSELWPTNLWRTGAALRVVVEENHSLDQWLDRFETAMHEIQESCRARAEVHGETRGLDP